MFLKNTWYVACQAHEITDKPLGRKICNEAMVFYKNAEGKVSAVQDFCPHRGAPLSLGRVCNGQLVCGYHGLVMGCDGHTVSMPGHQVRNFEPVKAYAVIERYGFVWVWPGDQSKVDLAQMPTFEWFDNPKWAYGGGLYHIACDYRLMIDNLMDLTHETYVHSTSIGQQEIDETPSRTVTEGDCVTTSRFMEGIKAPPFWKMAMRANDLDDEATVDRWQICKFTPPSHVLIEVGVALAGKAITRHLKTKPTAWWWISSRQKQTHRFTTSGAWCANSSQKTKHSPLKFKKVRAKFSVKICRCWKCSRKTCWPSQSVSSKFCRSMRAASCRVA